MKQRSGPSLSRRRFLSLTGLGGVGLASGWHLLAPSGAAGATNKVTARLSHFFPQPPPSTPPHRSSPNWPPRSPAAHSTSRCSPPASSVTTRRSSSRCAWAESRWLSAQWHPGADRPRLRRFRGPVSLRRSQPFRQGHPLSYPSGAVRTDHQGGGRARGRARVRRLPQRLHQEVGGESRGHERPTDPNPRDSRIRRDLQGARRQPTPLPYLEVYLALQQGTIDGAENPLSSGTDQKWPEVVKFVALTRHQATGQSFQVNERWYQGSSPDLRKAIDRRAVWRPRNTSARLWSSGMPSLRRFSSRRG